jgi:hypothetical protein
MCVHSISPTQLEASSCRQNVIILTTFSSSFHSSSFPVETKSSVLSAKSTTHVSSSKASGSHSDAVPTTMCVDSEFPTTYRRTHITLSSFTCSSSPLVVKTESSVHSTRTSIHPLSSTASTFNLATPATGPVSLTSRTSTVAYLSIGGAMAGFLVILIVAVVVSLSRRRKRRHSFVIPGIRHPFRPTNFARVDEEPFSGAQKSHSHLSRVRLPIQN